MLKEGSWRIHSTLDPRWNKSGRGKVGMFMGYESMPEAKEWIEHCKTIYGEIPDDCQWSYMKD